MAAGLLCAAARGADAPEPVAVPRYTHPGIGNVMYFVLTDRFANGSTSNDTGGLAGGPDDTGFDPTRISHYHGGDFVGLAAKLDYIKGLGATAIWVTPPFVNDPVERTGWGISAGYHGYWITDFTRIDPHLGTNDEFKAFVNAAHSRGIRVYMDIVVNHTADVIQYKGGNTDYVPLEKAPYRDAAGKPFDPAKVAYNGIGPEQFPALDPATSFPHAPVLPPGREHVKAPAWLNDVTLYHNRGDSTFKGESATYGDFGGLDDVFTENPRVVRGFIDVFSHWMEDARIDGFRIDTVKHVNLEFWQAFTPAIRAKALALGRPDFIEFGEVMTNDPALMSLFTTSTSLDGILDFATMDGIRDFLSRGKPAAGLRAVYAGDAYYTTHDGNAQNLAIFVGNHDAGRFASFAKDDNPKADPSTLLRLDELAQTLLLTLRGQPAVYYGDEQGMVGLGGDKGAREDMFASRSPEFARLSLLGTTRKGSDDKFDPDHPLYKRIAAAAALRRASPGLSRGALITRDTASPHVFAFSRIDRDERVEYLVAVNQAPTASGAQVIATCQPAGAFLDPVLTVGGSAASLAADTDGSVRADLPPRSLVVWKARAPLGPTGRAPSIALASPPPGTVLTFSAAERDGQTVPSRTEILAQVTGGDGLAEVTFALRRASRPHQLELLGTADAPPYRVMWRPPADLAPGDALTFVATVDDLRGHQAAAQSGPVTVSPSTVSFGIRGATVPVITRQPASQHLAAGSAVTLEVAADGTAPLEYHWIKDGRQLDFAGSSWHSDHATAADAGTYRVLVHSREGTALSEAFILEVTP